MTIEVRKYKKKDGVPLEEIHSFESYKEAIIFVKTMNELQLKKIESKQVVYHIPQDDFIEYSSQPVKDPLKIINLIQNIGFPLNVSEKDLLNVLTRKLNSDLHFTFEEKYQFCVLFWQVKGWMRSKK